MTYGLFNAQDRGTLFIGPGVPVYEGMVVGASPKSEDIAVNVCKKKHITNMRSSSSDEALRLVPCRKMSLEECLEFIADDELIEVTPKNLRDPQADFGQPAADEGKDGQELTNVICWPQFCTTAVVQNSRRVLSVLDARPRKPVFCCLIKERPFDGKNGYCGAVPQYRFL